MNPLAAKMLATSLVAALLFVPLDSFAQEAGQAVDSSSSSSQTAPPDATIAPSGLPESPGATQGRNQGSTTATTPPVPSASTQQSPSGTAAAPAVAVSGNVVSRPAGAAIAPPKQRQVRSFLIKMGLIAGAGVALGTVAALSLSSPARVPGSH